MCKQFLCTSVVRTQLARQFYSFPFLSYLPMFSLPPNKYNSYANQPFIGSEDMPIKSKILLMVVMVWMLYHCPVSVISMLWLRCRRFRFGHGSTMLRYLFFYYPTLTLLCSSSQCHPRPWYTMVSLDLLGTRLKLPICGSIPFIWVLMAGQSQWAVETWWMLICE